MGNLSVRTRGEGEPPLLRERCRPGGAGWAQSPIRYYVFALLFVLFDVEAVFIFPWATRLEAYGSVRRIEMIVFIVLLSFGLLYAWRKKVLQWL